MHEYTHVVVGKVLPALRVTDHADLNDARRQHDCFLRLLRELGVEVIEVELEGSFPGNILIEDAAVVCNGIALLPKPSEAVPEAKLNIVREALVDLGQSVIDMPGADAKLLGSDVLFTGREFFVGISGTSNEAGASAVAEAFPEFPCTPIKSTGPKPLKNYITICGPDVLCVGDGKEAQELLKRIEREATFSYKTLTVPEDEAANCLYVNGTLIHRAIEEIPGSFKVFCEKIDFSRRSICFSEIAKVSTGLSSCCLFIRKTYVSL